MLPMLPDMPTVFLPKKQLYRCIQRYMFIYIYVYCIYIYTYYMLLQLKMFFQSDERKLAVRHHLNPTCTVH